MGGCWTFLQLLCVIASQFIATSFGLSCNGSPQYCGLRFNQFTFPATHNSFSRPQSTPFKLYGNKEVSDADCYARNQGDSVTKQLKHGIRSIDIDTCAKDTFDLLEGNYMIKAYTCHKVFYSDPVSAILEEIDAWMDANPNEVVVLSFTDKVQRWNNNEIAKDIKKKLEDLWAPTSQRRRRRNLMLNDAFMTTGEWPTLREAVQLNQRIFLFMHTKLTSHMGGITWAHDFTWIKQTNNNLKFQESDNCQNLIPLIDESCQTDEKLISVDMFVTRGLPVCTTERANACNPLLSQATDRCYYQRKEYTLTVNFLKIDFPDRNGNLGYKVLKKVARDINKRNVESYIGINFGRYTTAK
ncbi:uncharacterized protein LOC116287148 [Actinia tenebrosa]|uniref:Uncharacterized protein LOC116287148 n=1 Tax=Actinia tenebrosa TaxID=6105 RepID=A0A6P8H1X2_ACTTE|nr:uncharacterized protein LOC116287148 [Actinia tenebrosa]